MTTHLYAGDSRVAVLCGAIGARAGASALDVAFVDCLTCLRRAVTSALYVKAPAGDDPSPPLDGATAVRLVTDLRLAIHGGALAIAAALERAPRLMPLPEGGEHVLVSHRVHKEAVDALTVRALKAEDERDEARRVAERLGAEWSEHDTRAELALLLLLVGEVVDCIPGDAAYGDKLARLRKGAFEAGAWLASERKSR